MITKKVRKKLILNKTTITLLGNVEKGTVKGGYWETQINTGCYSWHPVCASKPLDQCPVIESVVVC